MKIKHTPLGALASKKTIVAGAAALALVGGIAPALINSTYAEGPMVLLRESIYTTVGPDYFTRVDLDGITNQGYEIDVDIEDTSVATRYYGPDSSGRKIAKNSLNNAKGYIYVDDCDSSYVLCLQGKKIGETDIAIHVNGSSYYYNLVSVKLTPEANQVGAFGDSFSGTATIEGADEDLLVLDDYYNDDDISVSISGSRGINYRLSSNKNAYGGNSYVDLYWKIGDQYVGGGTYFTFIPLVVVNNIDDNEETDALIKNESLSFFKSLWNDYKSFESPIVNITDFETETGAIANVHFNILDMEGPTDHYEVTADLEDAELSNTAKSKLVEKLPGKVSDVKYKKVSVTGEWYYYYGNFPSNSLLSSSKAINYDTRSIEIGEFTKFGTPLNITLDVSDVPEVKDGYTRKFYVAMENGDKVELVDGEYDEKAKTFTFATQYLGNLAYGYVDEKSAPAVPNTGAAPEKVAMVATATFAPLAAIAFGAFIARNRKKAANKLAKKHNHFE